jgi:hypothetical protein
MRISRPEMHVLEKHSTSIGQGNYLARVIVESTCTEPPPEFGSNLYYPALPFQFPRYRNNCSFLFVSHSHFSAVQKPPSSGGSRTKGLPWAYDGPEHVH